MIDHRNNVSRRCPALFSRWLSLAMCATFVWLTFVGLTTAQEPDPDKTEDQPNREAQLTGMRRIAEGVKVTVTDDEPHEAERIAEPLFRYNDPARDFSDGSIWGYGKKGRPAAILSVSLHPNEGTLGWLYEFNSLSSRPVQAKIPGMPNWSTRADGLEFKSLPDAPAPAAKEAGRNRQFRELSSKFVGFESFRKPSDAKAQRYELRLIPRPIYRYSDPDAGLVDGAFFLMTYGTNPEIVLAIEVVRDAEKPVWKYALTRISYAEVHVDFDGREVWTQPHLEGTNPIQPYWLFFRPVRPDEEAELKEGQAAK